MIYLGLSVVVLGFLLWASWPSPPVETLAGGQVDLGPRLNVQVGLLVSLFVALAAFSVRQLRRSTHVIIINAEGLHDGVATAETLPWRDIGDIDLVSRGDDTYVIRLTLQDGTCRDVDLWGVTTPAQTVFSSILERWQRERQP